MDTFAVTSRYTLLYCLALALDPVLFSCFHLFPEVKTHCFVLGSCFFFLSTRPSFDKGCFFFSWSPYQWRSCESSTGLNFSSTVHTSHSTTFRTATLPPIWALKMFATTWSSHVKGWLSCTSPSDSTEGSLGQGCGHCHCLLMDYLSLDHSAFETVWQKVEIDLSWTKFKLSGECHFSTLLYTFAGSTMVIFIRARGRS